jgi:hypothetical protein
VAPFWLECPFAVTGSPSWEIMDRLDSFHMPSQPGRGLVLHSPEIDGTQVVQFIARLVAHTETGIEVDRELHIPVRVEPC